MRGQLTRGIANKGFSDTRNAVARINFFNIRLGRRPLPLTGHTSNVVRHNSFFRGAQILNHRIQKIMRKLTFVDSEFIDRNFASRFLRKKMVSR
jgi:hypothetical protein